MASQFGDFFKTVALIGITYALVPSAGAVGGMFMVSVLPVLFGGIFMGPLVDRWNKKHLMIGLDLLRAVCTLGIIWGTSMQSIWVIYVFIALSSLFSAAFVPARSAIMPELIKEASIVQATSSFAVMTSIAMLAGSALGGFLADWVGGITVLYLDALSYVISALCLFGMSYTPAEKKPSTVSSSYLQKVREGLEFVKGKPQLVSVFGLQFFRDFCLGYVYILFALFILNELQGTNEEIGIGYSMTAVAYLIGASFIKRYFKQRKFDDRAFFKIYFPFNILYGIGLGVMFNVHNWYLFLFVLLVANIFQSGVNVVTETSLLTYSTPEIRGRVIASWLSMSRLAYGISLPIFSVMGNQIPSGVGGYLLAAICVLSSVCLTFYLKSKLRFADTTVQETKVM
jgi:MFS transporter, DHA3 family, macrolide efflux protein